jgi:hypothetical protein
MKPRFPLTDADSGLPGTGAPLSDDLLPDSRVWREDRACCCPGKPVVRVIMPPTSQRRHSVDLLLCGHHYRVSRPALAAAGVRVENLPGKAEAAEMALLGSAIPARPSGGPTPLPVLLRRDDQLQRGCPSRDAGSRPGRRARDLGHRLEPPILTSDEAITRICSVGAGLPLPLHQPVHRVSRRGGQTWSEPASRDRLVRDFLPLPIAGAQAQALLAGRLPRGAR